MAFSSVKVVVMRCAAAKDVVRKLYGFVGLKLKEVFSFGRIVARPARYVRRGNLPQAARHFFNA